MRRDNRVVPGAPGVVGAPQREPVELRRPVRAAGRRLGATPGPGRVEFGPRALECLGTVEVDERRLAATQLGEGLAGVVVGVRLVTEVVAVGALERFQSRL